MHESLATQFQTCLPRSPPDDPQYVSQLVAAILDAARNAHASDVHLLPTETALRMNWRVDGVLHHVADFPRAMTPNVTARLKVLANLLTYRTEIPQEGRLRDGDTDSETRISTFPTLYGEKAVIRLFVGSGRYRRLHELGLPGEIQQQLSGLLDQTGGVLLLTGPAGSGKTTTVYACLREILDKSAGGRSLVSLEDPIEIVVPGVAQSQVHPSAGFTMASGLRSLLRQDPEVIMVGEIRDRETAETVFQASLTGHLVLTTFHAGSAAQAVGRLLDMEIEPYLLRSGLLGILCQRLVRRLCACARENRQVVEPLGLPMNAVHEPVGCPDCNGTGYRDRLLVCELCLPNEPAVGRAILRRADSDELEHIAVEAGMISQRQRGMEAVAAGVTSPAEFFRVFGTRAPSDTP